MPLVPDNLTFRRLQTDDPRRVTVFLSIDGTLADGTPFDGPWQSVTVDLTDEELAVAVALKDRAKVALCDRLNGGQ